MLDLTVAKTIDLISHYGYVMVLIVSTIEGPVAAILSGFIVSLGLLNGYIVYLMLMLGDIFGDAIYYALGRWGRFGFVERWGKYIGVTEERIEKLEKAFNLYHWKILAFAKLQAIGSVFLIAAGIARAPFWEFIWYNTLGSMPKIFLLQMTGFFFGKSYSKISNYIDFAAAGSFLLLFFAYWYMKKRIKSAYKEFGL